MAEDGKDSTQRIGQFLAQIGVMTQDQVNEVLEKQKSEPGKLFGQIAIELGYIDDGAIDRYLAEKHNG